MKKFLCGFLAGAIIFGGLGVFAVTYVANPVSFKVLVNGQEFISDPPALEVEGRTYLPLRAVGEALGVPVNWNEELRQAEVGNSAPVAQSGQYSRQNPAPLNTVQTINIDNFTNKYSMAVRIVEIERGAKAWEKIKAANMFNDEPENGYEYILAKIAMSCLTVEDDKAVDVSYFDFDVFSSNNEEIQRSSVVTPKPELDGKLYAGGNAEGYVVFTVRASDNQPKVVYGMKYDGSGGIWFALY